MKTEFNIKDRVWIHIGEPTLAEGRIVEIITLDHLKENYPKGNELYVIEIQTGIDPIYEVREFETISPDAAGPIMCYRNMERMKHAGRYLRKVGIELPHISNTDNPIDFPEVDVYPDEGDEPTPDQIHAALARAEQGPTTIYKPETPKKSQPRKRRTFTKRKKSDANSSNNS
jgi:hypothetical protein